MPSAEYRWSTDPGGRPWRRAIPLAVLLALGGCAADVGPPTPPNLGPPQLVIVNQGTSSERPLEQAMMHSRLDDYASADNLLSGPLEVGQRVEIRGFAPGSYYLTVVRKKLSLPVSDRVALTTARPLELRSGRYEVWVFDESFRIHEPTSNLDGSIPVPGDASVDATVDADAMVDADAAVPVDTGVGLGDVSSDLIN